MLPTLFIGHGNPMNALANNSFTQTLSQLGKKLPRPEVILCISAHWMTQGTWITAMNAPRTIHDFYGFPQALFDLQYPAPGSFDVANKIASMIQNPHIQLDTQNWGLDHGAWSILLHMYPNAEIPVVQLSLDMNQPYVFHFELGKKLNDLRNEGVLIVGSGNIVHNLQKIKWQEDATPYDWAIEFDEWIKTKLIQRDFHSLTVNPDQTQSGKLSIPTTEHYLPLLYVLGASTQKDQLYFEYEGIENGSISMRCVSFGEKPHG